jgi:hypothetical protein
MQPASTSSDSVPKYNFQKMVDSRPAFGDEFEVFEIDTGRLVYRRISMALNPNLVQRLRSETVSTATAPVLAAIAGLGLKDEKEKVTGDNVK